MTQQAHPGAHILTVYGKTPRIHPSAFIAPGSVVAGDVEIGEDASIWYNCVVRGDVNRVRIGARTNIQDGSVIHCDSATTGHPDGFPTIIGDDVLVGHMAMLHGCTLEDRAFVGLGTIVMNGCVIEGDGMLAAGAMLTPGKRIPARELWAGRPAALVRGLNDAQVEGMKLGVVHYVENAREHAGALKVEESA